MAGGIQVCMQADGGRRQRYVERNRGVGLKKAFFFLWYFFSTSKYARADMTEKTPTGTTIYATNHLVIPSRDEEQVEGIKLKGRDSYQ
jgi:hypothetical protein